MIREVVTAPTLLPVTVDEAAAWVRSSDPADNPTLELLVKAARAMVEERTQRTLLTTVLDIKLPSFPVGPIRLPRPPVASVASVGYYDADNALQALAEGTGYLTFCSAELGLAYLPNGTAWPATYNRPDAVLVRYTAGWTAAASIPENALVWIRMALATLFENREQVITGTIVTPLPRDFCDGLLDCLRLDIPAS